MTGEKWLSAHKNTWEEWTYRKHRDALQSRIYPKIGNRATQALNGERHSLAPFRYLEDGKVKDGGELTNRRVNRIMAPVVAICHQLFEDGLIQSNPVARLKKLKEKRVVEIDPFRRYRDRGALPNREEALSPLCRLRVASVRGRLSSRGAERTSVATREARRQHDCHSKSARPWKAEMPRQAKGAFVSAAGFCLDNRNGPIDVATSAGRSGFRCWKKRSLITAGRIRPVTASPHNRLRRARTQPGSVTRWGPVSKCCLRHIPSRGGHVGWHARWHASKMALWSQLGERGKRLMVVGSILGAPPENRTRT